MSNYDYISCKTTPGMPCTSCGRQASEFTVEGKRKYAGRIFLKSFYKVFKRTSWFRGEDKYLGKVCRECMKAGLLPKSERVLND